MDPSVDRALRKTAAPILRTLGLKGRRDPHVFTTAAPSPQAAVDIFAGEWITAFPAELGVTAGPVNHFDPAVDPRVPWVAEQLPHGLTGMSVLELGPFEAYQTALLEAAGAASVVAVEASQTAYLKCLIVKELLGLRAQFLYGDMLAFLDQCTDHFDIVWASGILYHQADPLGLLERIAERTDRVFLHTHCINPQRTVQTPADRRLVPQRDRVVTWHDRAIRLHRYEYVDDTGIKGFAGGPRPYANWLAKDDIEFVLAELGLSRIAYGVDDPQNPGGAAFFLLASRD